MADEVKKVTILEAWETTQFATEAYARSLEQRIVIYKDMPAEAKETQLGKDLNEQLQLQGAVLKRLAKINEEFKAAWHDAAAVEFVLAMESALQSFGRSE